MRGGIEPGIVPPATVDKSGHLLPSAATAVPVEASVVKNPSVIAAGIVFGKTEFSGLLQTSYVRLLIVNRDDPAERYIFSVGDRSSSSVLPWVRDSKVIEPGHFVLELPAGPYKVTQVAIPVGAALAEENMEIDFNVFSATAVYVGTLSVEGTKERVKFGGVPLIRPGFEYLLEVKDEYEEAIQSVSQYVPADYGYKKDLFTVVNIDSGGVPSGGVLKKQGE